MSVSSLLQRGRWLIDFFSDREYYSRLLHFALPIALQQFIMASLNMVGVVMIGQMGATSVAAVGLANQIFFLFQLVMFGLTSGAAIFTAQLWGKGDIPNIRKVLGLAITLGILISLVFLVIALAFPQLVLSIYSKDPAVVALGSQYLRIFGWAYIFFAITISYAAVLRSTGEVRIPLLVTFSALSLNTLLSYMLIFGKLGLPRLEVQGAALAGLIARVVECCALLWITYRFRTAAAASLKEMFRFDLPFIEKVLKPVLPVALNEFLWSMGITAYNVAYARIGTDSIAAMNIVASIDQLALVIFSGIGNACAVLVGNQIGAGEEDRAFRYAARSLSLGAVGGLAVGGVILLARESILSLYKVDPVVIGYAFNVLTIVGVLLWLRASNLILFVGIFRSGGDTRFALILDGVIIWVVGVPCAFLSAFAFHLPVYWVYLSVMSEEFTKWALGMGRLFSRKWIHNLTHTV